MELEENSREAVLQLLCDLPLRAEQMARLLADRFSCRGYLQDQVPAHVIEQILQIAQLTASWCNTQPWQVIVTTGSQTAELASALHRAAQLEPMVPDIAFPGRYDVVQDRRRKRAGGQLYESVGIPRGDKSGAHVQMLENFRFFGAPHVALITTPSNLGAYGVLDCGGYIANFMLAARAVGVDTTPQAAVAQQAAFLRRYFDLPAERLVLCSIAFGYADLRHPANAFRTERASLQQSVRCV